MGYKARKRSPVARMSPENRASYTFTIYFACTPDDYDRGETRHAAIKLRQLFPHAKIFYPEATLWPHLQAALRRYLLTRASMIVVLPRRGYVTGEVYDEVLCALRRKTAVYAYDRGNLRLVLRADVADARDPHYARLTLHEEGI